MLRQAGEIICHCDLGGEVVSLVRPWFFTRYDAQKGSAEWAKQGDSIIFVSTEDVLCSTVHTRLGADVVRTLVPFCYK